MVKPCFHVSSISCFLCCLFVSSFFVNSLVSQPFPRPDQIEILLAFKNEFPILKCDFRKWPHSRITTKSWTRNDVKSFSGVFFDSETGVVTGLNVRGACLSGTLNANSSLFRLHHLRYDDLLNSDELAHCFELDPCQWLSEYVCLLLHSSFRSCHELRLT
ncbi:PREDICTED: uncharacterized protein LOC106342394 isoform X3 [Brassica oleracea var. oleracea]|uniref:uncharacterized protein LOC106342394 isoform X3 n=1 Tax=Brassica oleracea var. oleracea TaxID=109376 RepID=UPI0006A6B6CA|nr:PREDICTED: uncharacterized protein LOC106342394 isoform X3 [Brassica oleracea var. oleracea]